MLSKHGKFFLDVEFTNGYYYLADIFEIALVAEESGHAFHSYVKINYSVPKRVQQLTGITNKTIGLPFKEVMDGPVEFLQAQNIESAPITIAHGGYLNEFPILLANCMKHNWTPLEGCMFVDSMRVPQNSGYKRPVLDALCKDLNIKRDGHSPLEDAYILKPVCNKKPEVFNHGYTFQDILYHLDQKLPLPIQMLYNLAAGCSSHQELKFLLYEYAKP